jgi:acetylornithine deacetylase/succinyl-diaminopimelate desuccinylase-like protein
VIHDVPIAGSVAGLMPELRSDLERLVAIPSISSPGYPEPRQPILDAFELTRELFRAAGVENAGALELPDTAPVLVGEIPAPDGAPTILLYSHYDVVAPGDESSWSSPPFTATTRDGAIFGRGAADSKSNVIAHAGALRVFGGRPPVGIKLVIEGQEEVGGGDLTNYALAHPEAFQADAMVIGDMGSVRPGVPTLTVALRGMAMATIELTTLAGAKHSGQFGGAAPDALLIVLRALASLHDEHGDVAVEGLRREPWTGEAYSDDEFRELAEVREGLPLQGTGDLGSRVWSGPAITVTGIDVPSVDGALNAVSPHARAKINLRVHPEQDAVEAQAALVRHLEGVRPFGIALEVQAQETGNGFAARTSGPAYAAARAALEAAWGRPAVSAAGGGSIPLVNALQTAAPQAEMLLIGTTDGYANIHAPDERVLLDEFEKAVVAEAELFQRFAAR